ncbi:MAG: transposase [Desulfobacterales bacterium]
MGYHFKWATKYRYQTLYEKLVKRVIKLVCQGEMFEMQILSAIVSKDHTQFLVTALPNLSPPNH